MDNITIMTNIGLGHAVNKIPIIDYYASIDTIRVNVGQRSGFFAEITQTQKY